MGLSQMRALNMGGIDKNWRVFIMQIHFRLDAVLPKICVHLYQWDPVASLLHSDILYITNSLVRGIFTSIMPTGWCIICLQRRNFLYCIISANIGMNYVHTDEKLFHHWKTTQCNKEVTGAWRCTRQSSWWFLAGLAQSAVDSPADRRVETAPTSHSSHLTSCPLHVHPLHVTRITAVSANISSILSHN